MPSSTRASDTGSALALPGAPPATPVRAGTRAWYVDVGPQLLRRKQLGVVGGVIVLVMLAAALGAEMLSPYGFADTSLRERLQPASAAHWLGTDHLGRDLLTRILYGARISLYVGFGAIALGAVLATLIGVGSAYFGGRVDLWAQRGVDAPSSSPQDLCESSLRPGGKSDGSVDRAEPIQLFVDLADERPVHWRGFRPSPLAREEGIVRVDAFRQPVPDEEYSRSLS